MNKNKFEQITDIELLEKYKLNYETEIQINKLNIDNLRNQISTTIKTNLNQLVSTLDTIENEDEQSVVANKESIINVLNSEYFIGITASIRMIGLCKELIKQINDRIDELNEKPEEIIEPEVIDKPDWNN